MGFLRLTPANARATRSAGVVTFVYGGLGVSAVGAVGLLLAALGLSPLAWEAAALAVIGGGIALMGCMVSNKRGE